MLSWWDKQLVDQASDVPSSIIKSCKILCKNHFNLFFQKITKMKIKSFECPKPIRNMKKKNIWNFRRLVDESFVPSAQRTNVLYCRLSDFWLQNYLISQYFLVASFAALFSIISRKTAGSAGMAHTHTQYTRLENGILFYKKVVKVALWLLCPRDEYC